MSNKFKNPNVTQITAPVNVEGPIQDIQNAFIAGLPWLEKCFGRAYPAIKSSQGSFGVNKVLVYPQVWQGVEENPDGTIKPLDMFEVLGNDNIKSFAFFKVEDPINLVEFVLGGDSVFRANVSIIFWFNLRRIDPEIDYPFTELLKGQVLRVLETMTLSGYTSINVLRVWEGALNVFRGYDISVLKDQELVYPWGGFRFELEVNFQENCPTDQTYELRSTSPSPGLMMANGGFIQRS